jgi:hypothetical protein
VNGTSSKWQRRVRGWKWASKNELDEKYNSCVLKSFGVFERHNSRLTEQRLVPFEAARYVAHTYDRPRALHRVPLRGPNSCLDRTWIQPVIFKQWGNDVRSLRLSVWSGGPKTRGKPYGLQTVSVACAYFVFLSFFADQLYCDRTPTGVRIRFGIVAEQV